MKLNTLRLRFQNFTGTILSSKSSILLSFAVVLILFVVLSFAATEWTGSRQVTKVEVKGNSYIQSKEVTRLLNDSLIIGNERNSIDLINVVNDVEKHPYISKAYASFTGIDGLQITVEERQPVAFYINVDNQVSYIDKEGIALPFRELPQKYDLPVVSGLVVSNKINKKAVKHAVELISGFIKYNDSLLYNISELRYDKYERSFNVISANTGLNFKLGDMTNIEEKLYKIQKVLEQENEKFYSGDISYIDLRWKGQVLLAKK